MYIAAFDKEQGEHAVENIKNLTGNDNVFYRYINLSEMFSVREFVKKFLEEENQLDVLVNNAGCCGEYKRTIK